MPRPLHLLVPGGIYHVTARGNRRQEVFRSEADHRLFLSLLARVLERLRWRCYAYCLMPNHSHLVLMTPEATLSGGMQRLNGAYASSYNDRYGLQGHLFQGRFHSLLVETTEHALELVRYLALNPVRAGLCAEPGEWEWSDYRATAGLERPPRFLAVEWVLRQFGTTLDDARLSFAAFVREGYGMTA